MKTSVGEYLKNVIGQELIALASGFDESKETALTCELCENVNKASS